MNPSAATYYRHRFPSEIISHCVWLYFRFSLSFRDVEEMMNERGVTVTYEPEPRADEQDPNHDPGSSHGYQAFTG